MSHWMLDAWKERGIERGGKEKGKRDKLVLYSKSQYLLKFPVMYIVNNMWHYECSKTVVQLSITIWWGKNLVMWLSVANTYCQLCQTKLHTFRINMNGKGFQRKLDLASERITQRLQSSVWISIRIKTDLSIPLERTADNKNNTHPLAPSFWNWIKGQVTASLLSSHCCLLAKLCSCAIYSTNDQHQWIGNKLTMNCTNSIHKAKTMWLNNIHYIILVLLTIFRIPKIIG